jgi:hypothetical protein
METMDRWKININDGKLQKIYEDFLFRANELLTFYLSCLVLDEYTEFKEIDLDKKIAASNNFHESATSIRNISDIKDLINSGSFSQNYRSQTFIALMTTFKDLLDEILDYSNIKEDQIKKNIIILDCSQEYCLNTAGAKIIHHLCKHYEIDPVINHGQGIRYINNLFNIRNLFIHSRGIFDEKYRKYLVTHWANMKHGEIITLGHNQFDAVFWFICEHLKTFISSIDEKLNTKHIVPL